MAGRYRDLVKASLIQDLGVSSVSAHNIFFDAFSTFGFFGWKKSDGFARLFCSTPTNNARQALGLIAAGVWYQAIYVKQKSAMSNYFAVRWVLSSSIRSACAFPHAARRRSRPRSERLVVSIEPSRPARPRFECLFFSHSLSLSFPAGLPLRLSSLLVCVLPQGQSEEMAHPPPLG
jgi:hypothetical protein